LNKEGNLRQGKEIGSMPNPMNAIQSLTEASYTDEGDDCPTAEEPVLKLRAKPDRQTLAEMIHPNKVG
jgi:hypothetical protein